MFCSTYIWADDKFTDKVPSNTNFRHFALPIFDAVKEDTPWFGLEQEYSLLETNNKFATKPLGWPDQGFPGG